MYDAMCIINDQIITKHIQTNFPTIAHALVAYHIGSGYNEEITFI